jgi:hypothetical protein
MEPKSSRLCSQKPTTGSVLQSTESNLHPTNYLFKKIIIINEKVYSNDIYIFFHCLHCHHTYLKSWCLSHCLYKSITVKLIIPLQVSNYFFLYCVKYSLHQQTFKWKLQNLVRSKFYVMSQFFVQWAIYEKINKVTFEIHVKWDFIKVIRTKTEFISRFLVLTWNTWFNPIYWVVPKTKRVEHMHTGIHFMHFVQGTHNTNMCPK